MLFSSSKSPFSAAAAPEHIGLGCQRRERRQRWMKRIARIGGYLGSLALLAWMLQGGIEMFLENFVWNNRSLSLQRFQVRSQGGDSPAQVDSMDRLEGGGQSIGFSPCRD
ncbi:hypothetical protein N8613_02905 [Verrucomicrobia bacterium]|nr:hypothetical protein [Verrucomicrobiota bacterium]